MKVVLKIYRFLGPSGTLSRWNLAKALLYTYLVILLFHVFVYHTSPFLIGVIVIFIFIPIFVLAVWIHPNLANKS